MIIKEHMFIEENMELIGKQKKDVISIKHKIPASRGKN